MKLQKYLKDMVKEEKMAPNDYLKIKKLLKSPADKRIIDGIIKQEKQHRVKVKKILMREMK